MNTRNYLVFALLFVMPAFSNAASVFDRVLSKALWKGDVGKATMAIKKGADVNKITYINFNRMPLPSIDILVKNGYNLNDKSKGCVLIEVMQDRKLTENFVKTVDYLIKNGAPVNCVDKYGQTVLHQVSIKRNKKSKEYLKAYKLILNNTNQVNTWSLDRDIVYRFKIKPLYVPIVQFNKDIFKLLINAGAEINGSTKTRRHKRGERIEEVGLTALKGAIHLGDLNLVKLVLSKGANINEVQGGMNAIDYAHRREEDDIEMYLLEKGAKYNKYSDLN